METEILANSKWRKGEMKVAVQLAVYPSNDVVDSIINRYTYCITFLFQKQAFCEKILNKSHKSQFLTFFVKNSKKYDD